MRINQPIWRTALALAFVTLSSGFAVAQDTSTDSIVSGVTKPSIFAKMALNQFGVVLELPVKEGQAVKKGDLLLRQDDRQEVAELKALQLEANSDVRVTASQADLDVKRIEKARLHELQKSGSATPTEVEKADTDVVYAEAQVKIAQLELQKAKLEAEKQQYKVDQMEMKSPVNGFVDSIDTSVGEVTDPQKPVMTIVQNDPLWIEFYLPVESAQKLKTGASLQVAYADEQQWQPATVIYRAPVADAASNMQKIRLEMKNSANKDTGLKVQIKLPPELIPAQSTAAAADAQRP